MALTWVLLECFPGVLLGVLLALRGRVRIGLLLVALGLTALLSLAPLGHVPDDGSAGRPLLAVFLAGGWMLQFVPAALLAAVLPDGRPRAGWGWLVWGWIPCLGFFWTGVALDPDTYGQTSSPLGAPVWVSVVTGVSGLTMLLGLLVGSVTCMALRLRRGSFVVRRQLKWLVLAVLLVPIALLWDWATLLLVHDLPGGWWLWLFRGGLWVVAIPVAVAVAILRHNLLDIDTLLSRSVSFLALSVLLLGLFSTVVLVGGLVLGGDSRPATAAATLACSIAFAPLRRRVQKSVDRWFDHGRQQALATVERFVRAVRDGKLPPEDVQRVLQEALDDPSLSVAYSADDAWLDGAGRPVEQPRGKILDVALDGRRLATVTYEVADRRPRLLNDVLRSAQLPVELAHSRLQLSRALADARDSRARIVQAGARERRLLERDLHDGAQQQLVAIGMRLRSIEKDLDQPTREVVACTVKDIQAAIAELRRIASGLRPAALDEGLEPALRHLFSGSPLPVHLCFRGSDDTRDQVRTACYYVVAEALANALKHANASALWVLIEVSSGSLRVQVKDDGVGGADASQGSGITGMKDRAATVGGSFSVRSQPAHGTVVEMVIPCAS